LKLYMAPNKVQPAQNNKDKNKNNNNKQLVMYNPNIQNKKKTGPKIYDQTTANLIRTLATPMHRDAEGSVSTCCRDSQATSFRASIDITTDVNGQAIIVLTANPLCSAFALIGSIAGVGVNSAATDRSGTVVPQAGIPFEQLAAFNSYRVVSAGASFKCYTPDLNNGGKVAVGNTECYATLPMRTSYYGFQVGAAAPVLTLTPLQTNYSIVDEFLWEAFGCTTVSELDVTEMHQISKSVDENRKRSIMITHKPSFGGDRLSTFYNLRSQIIGVSGIASNQLIGSPFDSLGFDVSIIQLTGCAANTTIGTVEQVIHLEYHETAKRSGFGISSGGSSTRPPLTSRQIDAAHAVANSQPSVFHDMEEEALGAGAALAAPTLFNSAKGMFAGIGEDITAGLVDIALPALMDAAPLLMLL